MLLFNATQYFVLPRPPNAVPLQSFITFSLLLYIRFEFRCVILIRREKGPLGCICKCSLAFLYQTYSALPYSTRFSKALWFSRVHCRAGRRKASTVCSNPCTKASYQLVVVKSLIYYGTSFPVSNLLHICSAGSSTPQFSSSASSLSVVWIADRTFPRTVGASNEVFHVSNNASSTPSCGSPVLGSIGPSGS